MGKQISYWWNINRTLSYDKMFNFIVGNRGGGKTYGFKEWAIRSFLKTGAQFVYARRFKDEIKMCRTFFDDIRDAFPDHTFTYDKGIFFIDSKIAGYSFIMATAKKNKSVSYHLVDKICLDEFILDTGYQRYIPDEVTTFLEMVETIARMRFVRVFLLSNAITMTNPYFLYFDISLPFNKAIAVGEETLIELVQNPDYIKAKKQTRFAKAVEGTKYAKYAFDNEFLRDTRTFVQKKTASARYYFTFMFEGADYGVWIDYDAGLMFVSEDVDRFCNIRYALTNLDHQPNTMFLTSPRKSAFFDMFCRQYMLGNVRFESIKIKNICNQVIKWTL